MEKIKIYKKMLELQKHLAIISKSADGGFGKSKYKYTSGNDLFVKARPKMDELGLMLFQEVIDTTHEHVIWKTSNGEKQQTFTEAKMLFTWVDADSGETIEHKFSASGFNDWDKALGSALTYAERYYVLKQFHMPTGEDDPDAREPEKTEAQKLFDDAKKAKLSPDWNAIKAKYKITSSDQLTKPQIAEIRKELGL